MACGSLGARTTVFCASLQGHNHRCLDSRGARKLWPGPVVCVSKGESMREQLLRNQESPGLKAFLSVQMFVPANRKELQT